MLQNINSHYTALTEADLENFGFDPDGVVPVDDEDYQVQFDAPAAPHLAAAQALYLPDPVENDGVQGQNVYMQCVQHFMSFQEVEDWKSYDKESNSHVCDVSAKQCECIARIQLRCHSICL